MFRIKKIIILLGFLLGSLSYCYAQLIPKGMNYQAVARNLRGQVIANEKIGLKIVLYSSKNGNGTAHYSEIHETTTDALGLFNLIVGEGKKDQGEYGLIPWNTENVWMEVSVKDAVHNPYTILSNSKLMAVPYAMHAGTTDRLVEKNKMVRASTAPPEPGVISTEWSVLGNAKTDASGNIFRTNSLGTTDFVDLILITNNEDRMCIRAGGDIFVKRNFTVGKDLNVGKNLYVVQSFTICDTLTVKKNVLLNVMSGSTQNFGPFTVANLSPTTFTGTLIVNENVDFNTLLNVDSTVNLNSRLYVNKGGPTKLTGTLMVDSTTRLNRGLYVNLMGPIRLTGTLVVDSCATFNDKIKILSQYSADTLTGAPPSGALQVGGGAYLKGNLYIGGIAKFEGAVAFGGPVSILNGTQSNDPNTGALVVKGGVGIGLNLNVGGAATIAGMTTIKDLSEAFNDSTGALKVFGGVGIRKRLNVGGSTFLNNSLTVRGTSTLGSGLNVTNSDPYIAVFKNNSDQHGISIQVNNAAPGLANYFMEFRNSLGIVGRVKGENVSEFANNAGYKIKLDEYETNILLAQLELTSASAFVASATAGLTAALLSVTPCVGFGACVTTPIPSLIAFASVALAFRVAFVTAASFGLVSANNEKSSFIAYSSARAGVTYESGAADYAEWLPKMDSNETFLPGYVVKLKNGRISKNTGGDGKLMIISTHPVVLGNMPDVKSIKDYEKVAFMGQVPVHVLGKVNIGDYILPSGLQNGLARAVTPELIKIEEYTEIVGVAWSASTSSLHNLINVAIGIHTNEISKVVMDQEKLISDLENEFTASNLELAKSVPGFKDYMSSFENQYSSTLTPTPDLSDMDQIPTSGKSPFNIFNPLEVPDDMVINIINQSMNATNGKDITNDEVKAFFSRIKSEPGYQKKIISEVQALYKKEMQQQFDKLKMNNSIQKR